MRTEGRGAVVQRWRQSQRPVVSRRELARAAGLDPATVRRFESGLAPLSLRAAVAIARVTDLPLEVLLSPDQVEVADALRRAGGGIREP